MPVEITMPKLGLTMASGTIARWMKAPGDAIVAGEPLLEVATDKINYEVESPASGTLGNVVGSDGEEFVCGAVLGTIALSGENAPAHVAAPNGTRILASPAARRLARERNVPLPALSGTGPRGRITLSDVHGFRNAGAPPPSAPPAVQIAPSAAQSSAAAPAGLDPKRRAIYRKMSEVALLPLAAVSADARVDAVRASMQRRADFGWTAYVVYAVSRLLQTHSDLRTDASTGKPFDRIDIGVAADTPHGLIVPVVRGADVLSLAAIQAEIVRLAGAARDAVLPHDDVGGGCFSISNVGPQKVASVSPLVDPPQTAILGIGAATQRAVVTDGAVVAAWMMTCVVTFDHRFIDGAPAARFLAHVVRALEDPASLL
ncbi:MAG: 2-oxo acid dehydrogenase subunit E2 [Candidatus Eremiobacteraeota bacterium]|nr:2-oxo acid dehydrogenase subunit E2 [Candidatus Eremiobacteraeota bacterium]